MHAMKCYIAVRMDELQSQCDMKEPHKCDTEGRKSFKYTISLYTKFKNMQNSCVVLKIRIGVTKRLVATRRHECGLWRADNFMFLNLSAGYMNVLTS